MQVTAAGYIGRGAGVTATATAEAPTREIEVLLKPGGIVHGRVLDADGAPVEGAMVFAQRRVEQGRVGAPVAEGLAPGVPGPRFVSIGAPAQTNAQGEFTTEAVEPGPYYLRATAPSLRPTLPRAGRPAEGGHWESVGSPATPRTRYRTSPSTSSTRWKSGLASAAPIKAEARA